MNYRFNYEVIIDYIKEHGLNKTQFCKLCNISISTLNKMLAGYLNININLGFKVCDLLNIKFSNLVKKVS